MSGARRASAWRALATGAALAGTLFVPVPAAADARPIRFDRLSLEQGLSQSAVLSMFQDSRGFMWFGTEDGLNRYDGYAFTVYRHDSSDPHSLPIGSVYAIDEDAAGNIWIGTEGGGIARWERTHGRFVRIRHEPDNAASLSSDAVRAVLVDRAGTVWIGTRDAGLDRLDPRTGQFRHYRRNSGDPSSLSDNSVSALYEDRSGRLWVGTNGGLNRFDPVTQRFARFLHEPRNPDSLSDDQVRAVFEDTEGALWVGTNEGGLNRLAPGGRQFEHFRAGPARSGKLSHDTVRAVLEDDSGRLWVGTDGGLNSFLRETGTFARYTHDPANPTTLSDNTVMSIFQDRGGVLWFGTKSGGISKWNPATWSFGHQSMDPSTRTGLADNNVTAFSTGPDARLWIGTFGGGLNVLDQATGRFSYYRNDPKDPSSLSDNRVMALRLDRQGTLWVGTFAAGLSRFDPQKSAFKTYRHDPGNPRSIGANGIMSLYDDKRGVLWVGTFGGGLNRFDRATESFTRFQNEPGNARSLSNDKVTCIAESPSGALWVGTDGGGLNLLDRATGQFRSFKRQADDPTSLAANAVLALFVDASGTLWIGTLGGGLGKLDWVDVASGKARFTNYSRRDGLPNQVVYGIEPDASGYLWLSTNNGLARFDPRTGTFKNYSASHGLQGNEFNFGAHYRDAAGRLYFGGPRGFNAFSPEQIQTNTHRPRTVLTAVLKANKPITLDGPVSDLEQLELSYRDQVVTFEFAGLDYAAPDRNRYAYKLDGFDADWIDLGPVHRLTYTNLDAGRYVLRVKAANNDGVWDEQGLALAVRVVPPPWRTWWAYLLYGLVVAAAILSVVRAQQRKTAREAQYRQRLELEVKARTQELAERNNELQQLNGRLLETSLTDSLTGLRNRRFLFEEVAKDVALLERLHHAGLMADGPVETRPLVFIMIDLDFFKPINDTCGHAAGDRVLLQVRGILEKASRTSDVLVRWGGDEFLLVGRNADVDAIEVVPERIRAMVEETAFDVGDGQVAHLTCSIGFATDPVFGSSPHILTLEQVVVLADRALYIAKKGGRNAWVGLMGRPDTTREAVLRTLHAESDQIVQGGWLELRSSRRIGRVVAATEAKPLPG